MAVLSNAVDSLNDLGSIIPILNKLGDDHVPRGVKPEHYPVAVEAIVKVVQDQLGDELTAPMRKAWRIVLNTATSVMIGDRYDTDLSPERIEMIQSSYKKAYVMGPVEFGDHVF